MQETNQKACEEKTKEVKVMAESKFERTIKGNQKGKAGKYCPFFETFEVDGKKKNKPCSNYCALFCNGLNSCVFHAINLNLSKIVKEPETK